MGLESATYIDDLTETNPVAGDNVSQGDDHLRLIKNVLKTTFPSADHALYFEAARADLASASSPDLGATTTDYVNITGTTGITGFATAAAGISRLVRFDDALTLTHNGTSFILPSADDITTAAGDHAIFRSSGSGNWVCVAYVRADGKAVVETDVTTDSINALAEGVHTISFPASGMWPTASNGATQNDFADLAVLDFDEGDKARFAIPMPKSWDKGVIAFRAFCAVDSGGGSSETAVFSLKGRAISDGDSLTSISFGTAQDSTGTWTANDDLIVGSQSNDITIAGSPANNDLCVFEVTRETSGTLGASVQVSLLSIQILYTINAGNDA